MLENSPYQNMNQLYKSSNVKRYVAPRNVVDGVSEKKAKLYDAVMKIVLDNKMEMRKVPLAASMATAPAYAEKLGPHFEAQKVDLNKDGVPDTIIWNRKTMTPAYINGYKLVKSDWAAKDAYYTSHPTEAKRINEPYSDWKNNYKTFFNMEYPDPENPYNRNVEVKKGFKKYAKEGWFLPGKPQKKRTPYNIFCSIVKYFVDQWRNGNMIKYLNNIASGDKQAGPSCVSFVNHIISPISMYRLLFVKTVLRPYFYTLIKQGSIPNNYKVFKEFCKTHETDFDNWFKDNYLQFDGTSTEPHWTFNPKHINVTVLNDVLVNGELNCDGADVEDGLVFLLGVDNFTNDEIRNTFVDLLANEAFAADFLAKLNYKGKDKAALSEKKKMKRWLTVFKKNAQYSTNWLLKSNIAEFYQNPKAMAKYQYLEQQGLNALFHSVEEAEGDAEDFGHTEALQPSNVASGDNTQNGTAAASDNEEPSKEEEDPDKLKINHISRRTQGFQYYPWSVIVDAVNEYSDPDIGEAAAYYYKMPPAALDEFADWMNSHPNKEMAQSLITSTLAKYNIFPTVPRDDLKSFDDFAPIDFLA
jgi:hypothetical protein